MAAAKCAGDIMSTYSNPNEKVHSASIGKI
jgi:hypothetical protein